MSQVIRSSIYHNWAFAWKINWQYFGFGNKVAWNFKKCNFSTKKLVDQPYEQIRSADQVKLNFKISKKSAHHPDQPYDQIRSADQVKLNVKISKQSAHHPDQLYQQINQIKSADQVKSAGDTSSVIKLRTAHLDRIKLNF